LRGVGLPVQAAVEGPGGTGCSLMQFTTSAACSREDETGGSSWTQPHSPSEGTAAPLELGRFRIERQMSETLLAHLHPFVTPALQYCATRAHVAMALMCDHRHRRGDIFFWMSDPGLSQAERLSTKSAGHQLHGQSSHPGHGRHEAWGADPCCTGFLSLAVGEWSR